MHHFLLDARQDFFLFWASTPITIGAQPTQIRLRLSPRLIVTLKTQTDLPPCPLAGGAESKAKFYHPQ